MKKFLVFLLITCLGAFTLAQDIPEPEVYEATNEEITWDFEDEWDPCSFSATELEQVEMLSDMFYEHAEEKIVQRLFDHPEYQDLIRSLTDELHTDLELILDVCRDGQEDMYDWTMSSDMSSVMRDLHEYIELV